MVEKNKETLLQANAAVSEGDYEGFLSYCSEDTKWIFVGDQTLDGKEAVRQYMKKAYVEPPKFKVERLIGEGDYVTAIGEISLKNEAGNTDHFTYCDVWRFEDGQLAELKAFVV